MYWASETAQWIKLLAAEAWGPEFHLRGGRKEINSAKMFSELHMCATHAHAPTPNTMKH